MTGLTVPELATLANQVFTGQRTMEDASAPYDQKDFINALESTIQMLEERVANMSEAQFAFRIPGVPEGRDWNHDQQHFNTAELITHMTHSLRAGIESLQKQGAPTTPPPTTLPPSADLTGRPGGPGSGGRSDLTQDQVLEEMRVVRGGIISDMRALPDDAWEVLYESPFMGTVPMRLMIVGATLHSASHALQLMEMQAHDLYPAS